MATESHKYVEARLREALALDDRTNTLDVQVTIAGGKVFLIGQVESDDRRRMYEEVVRELIDAELEIVNELWKPDYESPPESP